MGTSDVFKVFKIARAAGEYNLQTLKASRVTIYHEMHVQSFDFLSKKFVTFNRDLRARTTPV